MRTLEILRDDANRFAPLDEAVLCVVEAAVGVVAAERARGGADPDQVLAAARAASFAVVTS